MKPSASDTGHVDGALPEIVRRYLEQAFADPASTLRAVRLRQEGRLRTSGRSRRWMSFSAEERIEPLARSFAWDAQVQLAGPIHLRVLDRLAQGRGSGEVRLMSLLRLASSPSCAEMDSGALHRLLAESVWCPTGLRPGERLQWRPRERLVATARLRGERAEVELDFHFNEAAEVVRVHTPGRWGRFGSRFERRAWEGRFFDYDRIDGVLIPRRGEVGWYDDEGLNMVWEGRVTEFEAQPIALATLDRPSPSKA
jgi:hypothetical protein